MAAAGDSAQWDRGLWNDWAKEQWPRAAISIGWLRGTLSSSGEKLVAALTEILGSEHRVVSGANFHRPGGRLYAWGGAVFEGKGARAGCDAVPALLEWSDTALQSLERFDGQSFFDAGGGGFLRQLADTGLGVTRLDLAADFYGYSIDDFWAAAERGDFLPARVREFRDSRGKVGGGRTIYFGSRESGGSFVRMYEKGAQACEKFDVLRVEVQLMGGQALAAWGRLVASENPGVVVVEVLTGALDFRVGYGRLRGSAHASRDAGPRLRAWAALLGLLPDASPWRARDCRFRSFDTFLRWVETAWPCGLGKLSEALGRDGMVRLISSLAVAPGAQVSAFDRASIEAWRESSSCRDFAGRWKLGGGGS